MKYIYNFSSLILFSFFSVHASSSSSDAPAHPQKMRNFKFDSSYKAEGEIVKNICTVTNIDTGEFFTEEISVGSDAVCKRGNHPLSNTPSNYKWSQTLSDAQKYEYLEQISMHKSMLILIGGVVFPGNMEWQRPATPEPSQDKPAQATEK